MISASVNRTPKVALEALEPILKDSNYFLRNGNYRASPKLKPQIGQAILEIETQLTPAPLARIQQIIMRLMMHFPSPSGDNKHRVCNDYANMLQEFPEDLLCAAYQHILKNHKYHTLPKIADLIAFMDPEMARRKTVRRKLDILEKQASEGVDA